MTQTPFSLTHRTSSQKAEVVLKTRFDGVMRRFPAVVTRISNASLRVALDELLPASPVDLLRWNPMVEVWLALPAPHRNVATRARLVGIVTSYEWDEAPMLLDLEFPALTAAEESALKDSNPGLVVEAPR